MDIVDLAQQHEEMRRAIAIREALADPIRRPDICFGIIACVDCDDPIDPDRLQARPAAVRCITCQEALERHRRLFPGT